MRHNSRRTGSLVLGIIFVAFGIAFNKWLIETAVVSDRNIEDWRTIVAIFLIQSTALFLGVFFILKRPVGGKELLISLFSLSVSFLFIDLLLGFTIPSSYEPTKYGWTVSSGSTTRTIHDTTNNFRDVRLTFFRYGFRRWGDTNTEKVKALIIGDSITHMKYVSNGEEWYSYLERAYPGLELFVHGGGGYGTLQEFMVLDDHIDEIDPDLIIWQFCNNDYPNNLYELDRMSYPYNNLGTRPYLEDEQIVYKMPVPFARLRSFSFTVDLFGTYFDSLARNRRWIRKMVNRVDNGRGSLLLAEAHDVTLKLLLMVRERANDRPIYMFNACGPLSEVEQSLCEIAHVICLPGINEQIHKKQQEGIEVLVVNNGHWNRTGNQIAGESLVETFKRLQLVHMR